MTKLVHYFGLRFGTTLNLKKKNTKVPKISDSNIGSNYDYQGSQMPLHLNTMFPRK